jgi:hypothetical protein
MDPLVLDVLACPTGVMGDQAGATGVFKRVVPSPLNSGVCGRRDIDLTVITFQMRVQSPLRVEGRQVAEAESFVLKSDVEGMCERRISLALYGS